MISLVQCPKIELKKETTISFRDANIDNKKYNAKQVNGYLMSQNTGYLKGRMWSYDWGGSQGGLPGAGNALFLDLGGSYRSIGFVIIC